MAGLTVPQPAAKGTHVELVDISKSFGGVRALDEVSLKIGRGSISMASGVSKPSKPATSKGRFRRSSAC